MITLKFKSKLRASKSDIWNWITSVEGIAAEMRPLLRMTAPPEIRAFSGLPLKLGNPLFCSRILLFGIIPLGHSHITLVELRDEEGFVEESPMTWMKKWRHERWMEPDPSSTSRWILIDQLTFEAVIGQTLVKWFVSLLFQRRHQVLKTSFPDSDVSQLTQG